MAIRLNREGLEQALSLVENTDFRLNSIWSESKPSSVAAERYIADHGLEAFGRWHLAVDESPSEGSPARFALPYGDFRSLHVSVVERIKTDAERDGQSEIAQAADSILDLLARFTC
jgi:hypothetical protein